VVEARDRCIETIYQDLTLADNIDVGANVLLGGEPMRRRRTRETKPTRSFGS
jgi:simple sugar transport system ATP-binding protein